MALLFNKRVKGLQEVSPPILRFTQIIADSFVDYGGSITLSSAAVARNQSTNAIAPGVVSFQWYKNGSIMAGETSSNLNLTNQTITNNTYYCIATYTPTATSAPAINPRITSSTAIVKIRNYVIFTRQPSSETVVINDTATFGASAVVGGFKNMSGFDDSPGAPGYFGPLDYNSAISQGFNDEDIRYYLENVYSGSIGPEMIAKLDDINFGNSRNKNLQYQWFVDGVIQKTTLGPVSATAPGFNPSAHSSYLSLEISNPSSPLYLTGLSTVNYGIYLDLTDYPPGSKIKIEFNVTQNSQIVHRIRIPDLETVNNGINASFLTDGYIRETLPGTSTAWGTHYLLLEGGRLYGPITSDTYGSGFLAVASEINQGSNQRLIIYDGGGGPFDDMILNISAGFFKSYIVSGTQQRITLNGVTYTAKTPPRVKYFSTYTTSSSTTKNSSVVCKVIQINTSGIQAGLPQDSNISTWSVTNYACLNPDDSRKPGARINVVTNSGLKPSLESTWYGVWELGTNTDTCGIEFNIEIKDIVPRASFSETWEPFSVEFELNIGNGDRYRVYKVLDWNGRGTNANSNDRKTLDFNTNNVDGDTNVWYGNNGIELFRRTNDSSTKWTSSHSGFGLYWNPSWGTAKIYIRVGRAKRKRDGETINWFPEVLTTRRDNLLSYGRRFDEYKEPY